MFDIGQSRLDVRGRPPRAARGEAHVRPRADPPLFRCSTNVSDGACVGGLCSPLLRAASFFCFTASCDGIDGQNTRAAQKTVSDVL